MFRVVKFSTAAVLMLAITALPVILDRCAGTCEAHRDAVASAPACHHAASPGTHLGRVPGRCGHDQRDTAVTATKSAAPSGLIGSIIVASAATPDAMDWPAARRVLLH